MLKICRPEIDVSIEFGKKLIERCAKLFVALAELAKCCQFSLEQFDSLKALLEPLNVSEHTLDFRVKIFLLTCKL